MAHGYRDKQTGAGAVKLSVVTTLYRSTAHLEEFIARMSAAAAAVVSDYEIIMVNDGSPDDSQALAERLCGRDDRLSVVELSRNFGHHRAIMAGLEHARGDWVFLIDCDLEEPPELLSTFMQEAQARELDIVYGVQEVRKGGILERWLGGLFWKLFNMLSLQEIPENPLTVRLMVSEFVKALLQHREREVFLAGIFALTGFRQHALTVAKGSRGLSSYGLSRRVRLFVNAITSFSSVPLVAVFYFGWFISAVAGLFGAYVVGRQLLFGDVVPGFTSLFVSVWFVGGLILIGIGTTGIYISKVFTEVKARPYALVRSIRGRLARGTAGFEEPKAGHGLAPDGPSSDGDTELAGETR